MYKVVNTITNEVYGRYGSYLEALEVCAELNDIENSWDWDVERD